MMVNHNEFGITEEEFEEHGNDETAVQELLLEKMRRFISRHPEVCTSRFLVTPVGWSG